MAKGKSFDYGDLLVNPFSPNINMYILVIVLHIFCMLLVGRICLKIKAFHLW